MQKLLNLDNSLAEAVRRAAFKARKSQNQYIVDAVYEKLVKGGVDPEWAEPIGVYENEQAAKEAEKEARGG